MTATLVLPVRLMPADPDAPIELALALVFGVCADICVPAEAEADADASRRTRRPRAAPAIEAALAERAAERRRGRGHRASPARWRRRRTATRSRREITFAADPGPGQVAVLEAGQPDLWIGPAESRTEGRTVIARAPVEARAAPARCSSAATCG